MSFFTKIKQGLGIGTAKVELLVPGQIARDSHEVAGQVILDAKSDQKVKSIEVILLERHTSGRGEKKETKEYELGKVVLGQSFEIKKDERREVEFNLPFRLALSSNQSLAQEKGALGALGKLASYANDEKSEYEIKAVADLEGVALDPCDSKAVQLL